MDSPFQPQHFARLDSSDDRDFYSMARLVRHIDDPACAALARCLAETFPADGNILDLMSSYASHLPEDAGFRAVIGLGMNRQELSANPQLTGGLIHDLNARPVMPFREACFDGCSLAVSVQYLVQPVQVFEDLARVLRPGAPVVVSFSNRMFPTKATAIWRGLGDEDHGRLIAQYFDVTGRFQPAAFHDLIPPGHAGDPLYAVIARRSLDG